MSTDYDLFCTRCKKRLRTVASGSIAYGNKLWRDPKALDDLRDFFFEHQGHLLIFDIDTSFEDPEEEWSR